MSPLRLVGSGNKVSQMMMAIHIYNLVKQANKTM